MGQILQIPEKNSQILIFSSIFDDFLIFGNFSENSHGAYGFEGNFT
jgi:hypothetical protein